LYFDGLRLILELALIFLYLDFSCSFFRTM